VPLPTTSKFPKQHQLNGYTYQLLSSHILCDKKKDHNNDHTHWSYYAGNQKKVEFTYVAVCGPQIPTISLREKLESIANFATLPPAKAAARLELLTSKTNNGKIVFDLSAKADFEVFDDQDVNKGCGHMPEHLIGHFASSSSGSDKCIAAVQVRVFAPSLGVFKGMLCLKRNIKKIQLPLSMRKVPPSRSTVLVEEDKDWVCVVVKNQFPTSKNYQLSRLLCPNVEPSSLSFLSGKQDPGEMIMRLWQCLGVPEKERNLYRNRCNRRDKKEIKHAYFAGVSDGNRCSDLLGNRIRTTAAGLRLYENYADIFLLCGFH